jgi:hypothetical protein
VRPIDALLDFLDALTPETLARVSAAGIQLNLHLYGQAPAPAVGAPPAEQASPAQPPRSFELVETAPSYQIVHYNKAGAPLMSLHKAADRIRFDPGDAVTVLAEDVIADGGERYLALLYHSGHYLKKKACRKRS